MSSPPPMGLPSMTSPHNASSSPMSTSNVAAPMPSNSTAMDTSQRSQVSQASQQSAGSATATAASSTSTGAVGTAAGGNTAKAASPSKHNPTDQAVLDYLKSKGMGSAILELQAKLRQDDTNGTNDTGTSGQGNDGSTLSTREQLEQEEDLARNQRLTLTKATGGGFGYDRDSAAPVAQWGVPDVVPDTGDEKPASPQLGVEEARAYLDAFCTLQLWVLTLPDDAIGLQGAASTTPSTSNAIAKAQELIRQGESDESKKVSLSTLVQEIAKPMNTGTGGAGSMLQLPPSAKPELLAVSFALLVHTYCELLEVGMETTAHILRDAFSAIYEPLYGDQIKDLSHCTTTEDMVKLNTHNSQHMEALANLKSILVQIASLQLRKEEVSQTQVTDPQQQQVQRTKLEEYNQTITQLQRKHKELSEKASQAFDRMYDLPFLRRARAVRWQLTLSTTSYGLLAQFLSSSSLQSSLLSLSTLLQTKCELHVERRDPLPFTPTVVLDDNRDVRHPDVNEVNKVRFAAPVPTTQESMETAAEGCSRPFPNYHLQDEYDDERSARRDKRSVEFNRAMLVHGFRRLEALERKREFDVLRQSSKSHDQDSDRMDDSASPARDAAPTIQLANPLEPSILLSTLCADSNNATPTSRKRSNSVANPNEVGVAGSTPAANRKATMSEALWEESGIGLTCAKLCPPDGRRVAVGCDDSAVRIWDLQQSRGNGGDDNKEVGQVLLGHKNGFPVFDLSWNKDGRTLLSAGGDGSIRLWDTMAQGPFGQVLKEPPTSGSTKKTNTAGENKPVTNATAKETLAKATEALERAKKNPDMTVPGLKPETSDFQSGAALAVYRGHERNVPIWSVDFAPCGYYFASSGGDSTARLWTTDRPVPVRIFAGHTSRCVHDVVFHPNCNYILTGSDDKTARLWDIQTGRCVRLLNGCSAGIHQVQVDPSGQYAAGADALGAIHLWDLGTGKKVTQFRPKTPQTPETVGSRNFNMVHSMSFSACGTALATGGDDRCVRIWDVHSATSEFRKPVTEFPVKSFPTRRTILMDLQYTKRNLLLSIGKFISAVPLVAPISD